MDEAQKQMLLEAAKKKVTYAVTELTKPVSGKNAVQVLLARISEALTTLEEAEKTLLPANSSR